MMDKNVFHYVVKVNGKEYNVDIESENDEIMVRNVSRVHSQPAPAPQSEPVPATSSPTNSQTISRPSEKKSEAPSGGNIVEAPLPGKILRINVSVGQQVKRGELLLVLEAMKMENEILAPSDGVVDSILVTPNQTVNTHDALVLLK
ncbi:biotin/lipoyl-containing protein [Coprothermobacter platensis]|jgi:biotin carboxyl carrier protein|uniref:biotin/lipoyl-containing protein n=1 Tax=Coprothermobacter platensis TaxID=108819 RepID=UPI00039E0ABB|nr:biotin/lipoyl-containing protein [Coprothermobacter platensis]